MKKSKITQILVFSLIPFGVIILIFSIKILQKAFSGNIIIEIPYSTKSAEFTLTEAGNYSIWYKGQFFSKAPLDEFKPEITDRSTGVSVRLTSKLFRPVTNIGNSARMELFRFTAPPGKYVLELKEGSSISGIENSIIRLMPFRMVDYDSYTLQVRQSQSILKSLTGIILIVFAGFCIVGGFIFGLLIEKL